MKSLQFALASLALSAACAAQAQAPAAPNDNGAAPASQAQAHQARHTRQVPARTQPDCVGPASFCNIYFGS
ncbi:MULTISPECIES: hypothetical protein [Burkholderia]|uniref:hypothetical protein n=1 Tax=Burkholderia TaxID=32008 RepID=UPI0006270014|nr:MULTISPECIES: hypothetical protein [Burkholderia]KKJ08241.1 hypothetical protein XF14_01575 [Burkholderia gladioli]MBU9173538.1 hypothetical protein [Burkholderia gladioli]MDN7494057.1 hypothetical protein [Burkholderia gladioli]MDN7738064.1 hypothetical protein [Burkholderia gladioli]POS04416.1 hypothetical protein C3Y08_30210 [Burkholderia gladioli]